MKKHYTNDDDEVPLCFTSIETMTGIWKRFIAPMISEIMKVITTNAG